MAEPPKPDQWDVALSTPVPFLAAVAVVGGLIWLLLHLIYGSRISGFKEDIERWKDKLDWQKKRDDAEIDGLKRVNEVLNAQIGQDDLARVQAAKRAVLSEAAKELLEEIERVGAVKVRQEPQTAHEALVSGTTASLSVQGFVSVTPTDGGYFIVSKPDEDHGTGLREYFSRSKKQP